MSADNESHARPYESACMQYMLVVGTTSKMRRRVRMYILFKDHCNIKEEVFNFYMGGKDEKTSARQKW